MTTCLVADDHPAVASAVSHLLERAGYAVIRATSGTEAADAIASQRPSLAVLDADMPDLRGTEVARRARRTSPDTAVVVYAAYGDRSLLLDALEAGVRGDVVAGVPLDELLRAVRLARRGETPDDPGAAGGPAAARPRPAVTLTERERDVLRLLAEGLDNAAIGRRLYIAPETVRTHLRKAMTKLGAVTRTQAVATALREGIIA